MMKTELKFLDPETREWTPTARKIFCGDGGNGFIYLVSWQGTLYILKHLGDQMELERELGAFHRLQQPMSHPNVMCMEACVYMNLVVMSPFGLGTL